VIVRGRCRPVEPKHRLLKTVGLILGPPIFAVVFGLLIAKQDPGLAREMIASPAALLLAALFFCIAGIVPTR
jgi:hypothetical protein